MAKNAINKMNLTKGQISNLSGFDMIIAISPPNSRSNFFLACNFKKLVLNVLLMFLIRVFFVSAGIKLVVSFFLATLLVVAMFDFQI